MTNRKDLKIESLSKYRYRELKYFCRQYPEWKEKLKLRSDTLIKAVSTDGMPKGSGIGNPTEQQVIDKISLEEKCRKVEQSAVEADSSIYPWILKNVTQGTPYEYLDVPCGRRRFYETRTSFFYILNKKGN